MIYLHSLPPATHTAIKKEQAELHILQWQNKSARHQQAWQSAEEMWQLMGDIKPSTLVEMPARNKTKYWPKYLIPTSIAACLVLALTLSNNLTIAPQENIVLLPEKKTDHIIEKEYKNHWKTQHRVLLPDNSVVHLNFNSTIKINFSDSTRHIELLKGEAFFEVAKNPKKPFIVKTGNSTASALGTAFIVRLEKDNSSLITVTEGVVEVALLETYQPNNILIQQKTAMNANQSSVVLTANESVTFSSNEIGEIQKITSKNIGSWHRGVLIFKDEPLQSVLAEIDRYTAYNITANLRLSL